MKKTVPCNPCVHCKNGLCMLFYNVSTKRMGLEIRDAYNNPCTDYEVNKEGGQPHDHSTKT